MKSFWLSLIVVAFAWNSLKADEAPKAGTTKAEAVSAAEQYQNNPDDKEAFTAWLNETFKEISDLMEPAPEDAERKLAAAKEFLSDLKPESSAGKSQLTRAKLIVVNYEGTLALLRVSLADVEKQLEEKPADATRWQKYGRKLSMEISPIARIEPDKAEELLNAAKERVEKLKEAASEKAVKTQIESLERLFPSITRSIEHGRELAKLIGTKAPAMEIEDWANGDPLTVGDLKGNVVLLDFWAIWCGPCIATFPHLREWQEKYADKGLVIVGMTRYYNYKWDDEAGKPVRGKEKGEVSREDEQAMLKRFAEHHRLHHRFAIQTEDHELANELAVQGIPQAVVIDRQGVVRLIRVGSGSKNAKAIHDMIEKLLADKPVAAK